jgi:hypothetical protein
MKMQTNGGSRRDSRTFRSLITALGMIAGFALPAAFAGGDDGGGGGSVDPSAGAPTTGDDVTTLPSITSGGASGTVLFGQELEIIELLRTARGTGHVEVFALKDGEIAVAFTGDWNLRFRRSVLETTRVRVAFVTGTTFEDARARLVIGDAKPLSLLLTHPTLEMPLANFARNGSQGLGWDFTAVSANGPRLRNVALFRAKTVTLLQRASF